MGKKTRADWELKFNIVQSEKNRLEQENRKLRAIRGAASRAIMQMSETFKDLKDDIKERSEALEEALHVLSIGEADKYTTADFEVKDVE